MTCGRVLLPVLVPMLAVGAINRLPAHFEPREDGFLVRTAAELICYRERARYALPPTPK